MLGKWSEGDRLSEGLESFESFWRGSVVVYDWGIGALCVYRSGGVVVQGVPVAILDVEATRYAF